MRSGAAAATFLIAMNRPRNFEQHLHDEDYRSLLETPVAGAAGLVCRHDGGLSLDGLWHYSPDQYDSCLRGRWYLGRDRAADGRPIPIDWDFEGWPTIEVPSVWNLARPELFYYEGPMVYTREFEWPPVAASTSIAEREILHFHGSAYETFVFLNGDFVGRHRGASTPFCLEITGRLQSGTNRLLLVVDNTRRRDQVPAPNTDWFNYGGIHRSVEILRLPQTFVRYWTARLGEEDGTIVVEVEVDGPRGGDAVFEIEELGVTASIPVRDGCGAARVQASPSLWSPSTPRLYDCRMRFGDDVVDDRIGFRRITVDGRRILCNGQDIFLRGVSMHEDHPVAGRARTADQIRADLRVAKELGCNYIRLAHYPHAEQTAGICDELGLLVWAEIPVYWSIDFSSAEASRDAGNQLSELIRRDANRASVAIWSVGNENADTDDRLSFMRRLAESARRLDGSRLVAAACLVDKVGNVIADRLAEHLDIIGINEYLGWYDPDFSKLPALMDNSRPDKPVIISEFGAGAVAGYRGRTDELFTEDMQAYVYEKQIEVISQVDYIRGMSPWILFDFRSPRRTNRHQAGYNRKGLVDADRVRRKAAFSVLQAFYRRFAP